MIEVKQVVDVKPEHFWLGYNTLEFKCDGGTVNVSLTNELLFQLADRFAERVKDVKERQLKEAQKLSEQVQD